MQGSITLYSIFVGDFRTRKVLFLCQHRTTNRNSFQTSCANAEVESASIRTVRLNKSPIGSQPQESGYESHFKPTGKCVDHYGPELVRERAAFVQQELESLVEPLRDWERSVVQDGSQQPNTSRI
jgi:hypothetical protein